MAKAATQILSSVTKSMEGKTKGLVVGLSTELSVNRMETNPKKAEVITKTSGICHLSGR